jgi:hypothetical protein
MQDSNLKEQLYQTAINGTLFSLNIPNVGLTRWLVARVVGKWLSTILDLAFEFDRRIEEDSLTSASQWISEKCGLPVVVNWAERIPADGPVLLAANHPGYFEGMAIAAQLPRQDLKVLVGGIPYFSKLPNMKKHVMYTDRSTDRNIHALRQVIRHLRSNGIVLIFPTGHADPDPDTMEGAHRRFEEWSESIALILRRVPETRLLPAVVSGILEPKFLNHPLVRMQTEPVPLQRVAGFLQIYAQFGAADRPPMSHPRVSFGESVDGRTLVQQAGKKGVMSHIINLCQTLLAEHMALR